MNICETECHNGTSPVDMDEDVNDRIYDKNENKDEGN